MANILTNIIPDPDTGLYSSRVAGINGNECVIDNFGASDFASMEDTVLFYLKNDTDYSNKLSFWGNNCLIPITTFNPGIDKRGWVFHVDTDWTWLDPQVFEQQQYAPFWIWPEGLNLGASSKWCYFDRSYIGEHWSFQKQYINPNPTNSSDNIYDTVPGIDIVDVGKVEGFGVYLWVNQLQEYRSFIKNSESKIFMSNERVNQPAKQLDYVKVK